MKRFWKKTTAIILASVTGLFMLGGCGNSTQGNENASSDGNDELLTVYTSFYPMYDFAQKIAGDKINLVNLVPAGTEPHDWEPSTGDIANLEKADMLIYNGAGMEHWVEDVTESLSNKDLILVEASHGIELLEGHHHDDCCEEEQLNNIFQKRLTV